MLYRNGENLKSELKSYLTGKNKVTIFSPYIKSETLIDLLQTPDFVCEQIVVRWEPNDFAYGSSDLEIYDICKNRNIFLYMNNRIHLKLFTDDFKDAFFGSANISKRAIHDGSGTYNYEICSYSNRIDNSDSIYLQKILNESILVTDDIVAEIKDQIPPTVDPSKSTFNLSREALTNSDFLISKLPMTQSPDLLWKFFSGEKNPRTQEERNCFTHDIALYKMSSSSASRDQWQQELANNFFSTPFISAFLKKVDSSIEVRNGRTREGLRFGSVRNWFSQNTTTVPSPRAFELTENVQILYEWIEYLSFGKYSVTVPGARSQVIVKNSN